MTTHFIAATEESAGKTAVALALALIIQDRGQTVGFMKPKGTRYEHLGDTDVDSDAGFARNLLSLDAPIDDLEPIVYSHSFIESTIRGEQDSDDVNSIIRDRFQSLANESDVMIVEGGRTVISGGVINATDPALADCFDARVILVAAYRHPRDVDTILAAATDFGDHLGGIVFNGVSNDLIPTIETDVAPFFEQRDIPVLGILPRITELAGALVTDFATELGADIVTDTPMDTYIEQLLVGAMGPAAALRYFRRVTNAVVITGGDRSDIHSVALETPGVNCLCLTGGYRPSQAIIGKAQDRGIPILVVNSDTMTTIERAEQVLQSGRVRETDAVVHMQELLESHTDLSTVLGDHE